MASGCSLAGKTAVVTGATTGIGLAILLALAAEGANVIGIGRNEERCRNSETLTREKFPDVQVNYLRTDLSLQSQVKRLAVQIQGLLKAYGSRSLDILVNNAGVYSEHFRRTSEDIELTLAVNHLAPFLLTHELLPVLTTGSDQRIINVSSFAHIRAAMHVGGLNKPCLYIGFIAYMRTKLANILFTREFNRRMSGGTVRAFALDPGLVNTEIAMKEQGIISRFVWSFSKKLGGTPDLASQTAVFLSREKSVLHSPNFYWRDLKPKRPGRIALNDRMAADLWDYSCKLCGIPDYQYNFTGVNL